MPESKPRKKKPVQARPQKITKPQNGNPRWLVPAMLTFMLLGLAWIVVFYLSGSRHLPIPSLESWNLAIGFGLILVGFGMTTQWK